MITSWPVDIIIISDTISVNVAFIVAVIVIFIISPSMAVNHDHYMKLDHYIMITSHNISFSAVQYRPMERENEKQDDDGDVREDDEDDDKEEEDGSNADGWSKHFP